MTVTYSDRNFLRLLLRWRGSIWKSLYQGLILYLLIFTAINLCYHFAMTAEQKLTFQGLVHGAEDWIQHIPLQFLLGFYVSYIVARWWDQLMNIPWPDKFLLFINANITGNDAATKKTRRTIARWAILHAVLVWKEISVKIKKRFPTDKHMLKAGLLTETEFQLYENTSSIHGRWFVPVSWILNLMTKLNKEGKISDYGLQKLVGELYAFRSNNGMLTLYDWVNAPLRYTQVVTLATYGYFTLCLIGRQTVTKEFEEGHFNLYVPVGTILEYLFYVGWLKVAEEYRVPFGEDDDDFDMNYILDRDVHVANMLVDELAEQEPPAVEDRFWNDRFPVLPHTKASVKVCDCIPDWRLHKYRIKEDVSEYLDHAVNQHQLDMDKGTDKKKDSGSLLHRQGTK